MTSARWVHPIVVTMERGDPGVPSHGSSHSKGLGGDTNWCCSTHGCRWGLRDLPAGDAVPWEPCTRSLLLLFLLLSHTGPTRNHLANQILFPVNPLPCSMDTHSHRIPQTRPRSPLPSSFSPLFPSALGFRVQQQPLMGSDLLLTDSQGSYWVGSWIIHHSRSNR